MMGLYSVVRLTGWKIGAELAKGVFVSVAIGLLTYKRITSRIPQ